MVKPSKNTRPGIVCPHLSHFCGRKPFPTLISLSCICSLPQPFICVKFRKKNNAELHLLWEQMNWGETNVPAAGGQRICSCWGGWNRKFCKKTELSPRFSLFQWMKFQLLNCGDVWDICTFVVTSRLPPAHLYSAGSSLTRAPLKAPKRPRCQSHGQARLWLDQGLITIGGGGNNAGQRGPCNQCCRKRPWGTKWLGWFSPHAERHFQKQRKCTPGAKVNFLSEDSAPERFF